MKKIYFMDRIKSGILESGWDPDKPMGLQINQSAFSKTPLTGKQKRVEKRADKWASIEGQLEKDGASIKSIRDAKAVYDNTDRGGGRPTGDSNKHRLGIYPTAGKPKGSKNRLITVGGLEKKRFVTMDNLSNKED